MKNPEVYKNKSATIAHPTHGGELNQNKVSFQHEKHHAPPLPPPSHNDLPAPTPYRNSPPTRDEIAARAHALFIENGSQHGHDLDHWLTAEAELTVQLQAPYNQTQEPSSRA